MAKILVTGSNGLLGQKLLAELSKKDHAFLATSFGANRNTELDPGDYREMDITSLEMTGDIVRGFNPDYIINTAAMTQVDDCESQQEKCYNINVKGVENLLATAAEVNAKLLHISTDFIFDGEAGPYREDDSPNPVSYYGWSKLEAEKRILEDSGEHAIIRTVLVYGMAENMSRSNIVLWVKDSLEAGKDINVVNDQWRSPTLAEDLAKGCLLAVEKNAKGIYHISGDEIMTPYELALRTARHFELDEGLVHETDGSRFQQAAKRPPKTGFDISKARRDLGYNPVRFENGLDITADLILKFKS